MKEEERMVELIKGVLKTTKDEAMTVNDIANAVHLPHGRTGELVRKLLKQMILPPYCIPIVSSSCGYWIATCDEDVVAAINGLEGRIKGIQSRIDALQYAWDNRGEDKKDKQLDLFEIFGDLFVDVF